MQWPCKTYFNFTTNKKKLKIHYLLKLKRIKLNEKTLIVSKNNFLSQLILRY